MARFTLLVLVLGLLLLGAATAFFVVPPPTRTISLTPFDFKLIAPLADCEYSVPFNASAGEVVSTELRFFYLWNDSLVLIFNGSGRVDAPKDACDGVAPLARIPSDGQYMISAFFTRQIAVGNEIVNATVLVEGNVVLTRPDAYTIPQLVLASAGVVLAVWGYANERPRKPSSSK